MAEKLALGRNVMYTLSKDDVAAITRRRSQTGLQGSEPSKGQVLAATIVAINHDVDGTINLKVLLDGEDVYWAANVLQVEPGQEGHGRWRWPYIG